MRNAKTCPKCQSSDIIRIPADWARVGYGSKIKVGWMSRIAWFSDDVMVTRYLCASCGFSEEWIDGAHDISLVKKKYR